MNYKKFLKLPRWLIVWLIIFYQKTLSFDHGPLKFLFPHGYCRFYPSCSEYGKQTILKNGLLVGIPKTVWRVVRCNPWSKGGMDLP